MIRKIVPVMMCAVLCIVLVTPVSAYNAFNDGNFESWSGPWTLQGRDSHGWDIWVSDSDWSYSGPANLANGVYQSPTHSFRSFRSDPMSIWQTIDWGGGPITYYVSSSGSYTVTVNEVDRSSDAKSGTASFGPMVLDETVSFGNESDRVRNVSELNATADTRAGSAKSGWEQRSFTPSGNHRALVVTFSTSTPNFYIDDISTENLDPPVANFTGSPTSGTIPLTVQFNDTSTGSPTSWNWSFGDGGTSVDRNPSHEYTSAGTYTVSLMATNSNGSDTETKIGYITVSPTPGINAFRDGDFESWSGPWTVQGSDSCGWDIYVSDNDWSYSGPANLANGEYQSPTHSFRSFESDPMSIWETISWGGGPITYSVTGSGSYTVTVTDAGEKSGPGAFGETVLNETINLTDGSKKLKASYINQTADKEITASEKSSWQQMSFTPSGSPRSLVVKFTTTNPDLYIDDISTESLDLLVANFTGSPTSGTAPLTVQFNDTSTGSPTSWDWSFGDGGTSAVQNASHIYTSPGTYTVNLTVANAAGNGTEVKSGYVTVSQRTTYYVYADGVSLYHDSGGNSDLYRANHTAQEFYNNISGKQGDPYSSIHWEGIGNPVDDATGSRNWNINQDANTMANNADFALHAGHGWNDGILFGTANTDTELFRTGNLSFGGNNGRAKWVALFSCDVLNESTKENWKSVFNGLHILMAFDTHGLEGANQGSQLAQRMTGDGIYPAPDKIVDAWIKTLKDTINDASYKGAYMYANPSGNDYLPGFGTFLEPVKNETGQYTIQWAGFICERDW